MKVWKRKAREREMLKKPVKFLRKNCEQVKVKEEGNTKKCEQKKEGFTE